MRNCIPILVGDSRLRFDSQTDYERILEYSPEFEHYLKCMGLGFVP
jgi:hypothetical protein